MEFSSWLLFTSMVIAATISPGPNVLIVILHSLQHGYKAAIYTIFGNVTALFIYALISAVGVGTLLQTYPQYLIFFRLVGAAYLIYLGLRMISANLTTKVKPEIQQQKTAATPAKPPKAKLFKAALYCSLSNPKSILFFSSIFPQFIRPDVDAIPQFAVMFATIIVSVGTIHMVYAFSAEKSKHLIAKSGFKKNFSWVAGCFFVLFGLLLIPFRRA